MIASDQALAQAAGTKLGAELVAQAREVEARMQACCEHTLAATPGADKELERLAPRTGYKDDAGDLEGYADLYDGHPERVKLDGVNYREGDPALARDLAKRILAALAAAETPATRTANARVGRGDAAARRTRRWRAGSFLVGEAAAEAAFPSLFT